MGPCDSGRYGRCPNPEPTASPPLRAYRDDGMDDRKPFTFMQEEHLLALDVACRAPDDRLMLDADLLAQWTPPEGATDTYVLEAHVPLPNRVERSPTGTRIDPLAAHGLWKARREIERHGAVTPHCWCDMCGRHFESPAIASAQARARAWQPQELLACAADGYEASAAHGVKAPRWCLDCRTSRKRKNPQLKQCAAPDCDNWFKPGRGQGLHCSNTCRSAAGRWARASSSTKYAT